MVAEFFLKCVQYKLRIQKSPAEVAVFFFIKQKSLKYSIETGIAS